MKKKFLVLLLLLFILQGCTIIKFPKKYKKGTELYYLSWIRYGNYPQKFLAGKKLIFLKDKKEYKLTKNIMNAFYIYKIFSKLESIDKMLLLALFDISPETYKKDIQELLVYKTSDQNITGEWIKTETKFENKKVSIDYFFDWSYESALKLIQHGFLSDETFYILLDNIFSTTFDDKISRGFNVLYLINEFPIKNLDILINSTNNRLNVDLEKKIYLWYEENKPYIYWDEKEKKYYVYSREKENN